MHLEGQGVYGKSLDCQQFCYEPKTAFKVFT